MAASLTSFHSRSISLPSRPHPVAEQFEEHLCRLRSSENASTTSTSHKLSSLVDLYDCVNELVLLPANQQAIAQEKSLDSMLDGSLRLLDICSTATDGLQQTKEQIQNIQSVLRRRSSGELSIADEVAQYLSARKSVKKAVKNCLTAMKKAEKIDETSSIMGMLKDVETMTAEVFKSLLIQVAGSKKSSWSLVTKLVNQKDNKGPAASSSDFEELDSALSSLVVKKKKTSINMMQVDNLTSQMLKLESEIQEIDEALESVFRHLVKSRASILNIISQ